MSTLSVELTEEDLKRLVALEVSRISGQDCRPEHIKIEVKSKNNYRAEWETAAFRARYENSKA